MKKISPIALSITLTGWPAAVTICFGVAVVGGVIVYLGTKLIDNGYEITSEDGVNVTRRDYNPSDENTVSEKEAA